MERRAAPVLFAAVLVSFLLPWFSISCQGQEMVTATGAQILTSDYQSPMAESLEKLKTEGADDTSLPGADAQEELGSNLTWRIGAGAVLASALLGLVLTLRNSLGTSRWAMTLGGLQSAVLLGALFYGPVWLKNAVRAGKAASSTPPTSAPAGDDLFGGLGDAMGEMMLNSVKLTFGNGFYLALGASLALIGLGYYLRRPRPAPAVAAPSPYSGYDPPTYAG